MEHPNIDSNEIVSLNNSSVRGRSQDKANLGVVGCCAFRVNRYEITYRFACVQIDRLEGGEEDDFGIVVRNEVTSWNKFREKVCRK